MPDAGFVEDYLKDSEIYLGYEKQKPVCYFAFKQGKNNRVELVTTGVLPDYQGQGIGKQIIAKLLELNKGKTLHLVTHPRNIAALVLHLKSGFVINGWKENYFGDGEPRLLMQRQT